MKRLSTASSLLLAAYLLLAYLMLLPGVSSQDTASCISNLTKISDMEEKLTLQNLSVARKYVLCPNTIFNPVMVLRSNATVQCGDDGSSANSCVLEPLQGGDDASFAILIAPGLIELENDVENVVVQGLTVDFFTAVPDPLYAPVLVDITKGSVTFKDCIFSNNRGEPIFFITYSLLPSERMLHENDHVARSLPDPDETRRNLQSSSAATPNASVTFTFDSCRFQVSSSCQTALGT